VAKKLGFNDERFFYCTLIGFGYEVEGAEPEYPLTLKTLMDPEHRDVFHFMTPRAASDNFVVFSGGFDPRKNYDSIVNRLLSTGRYASWFRKARKVETVCFAENVYTPIAEPYRDNCLLVGDAAWCQEIEITGAILSGFRAASAVTVALADGKINREGVEGYLQWWKKSVYGLYDHRDYLRPFTMPLMMTKEEISYLFSLFPVLPSTLHAYKAVELLGAGIQSIIPRIAQERPELLGKIQKFATTPLEYSFVNFAKNCFPNR
jgi:flavin-dependent dehydrogenase